MPSNSSFVIYYVIFFAAVMYLMVFLPQRRRDKKAKEMLNSLQVGQNITTIGGIYGKVINLKDDEVTIETSVERTQINIKKWAVKEVEKPVEA